ncbi:hypothetical protein ACN20G_02940 [Streptomyces sp. BI20]|uniref:hypothetical protein n=1 Tax=Streptomyces sp. BI20 TaxID=3403460 RepID=UPI003C710FEC
MTPPSPPAQHTEPGTPGGPPPGAPVESRRHVVRRRWITAIIIVLLIGVPAGYLLVSARQSRDSGKDKAAKAAVAQLRSGWPSRVQQSIYEVPIPDWSTNVGFLETNNWRTSRLYVQFSTTPAALDTFLGSYGTRRAALTPGSAISARDSQIAKWKWAPKSKWFGVNVEQADPRPDHDITVDLTNPAKPRVYLVATSVP